jgi:hypothetical protein
MRGKARVSALLMFIMLLTTVFFFGFACRAEKNGENTSLKFSIISSESAAESALDGRLLLMISDDKSKEPRFQINTGPGTQIIFGVNVEDLQPGEAAVIDGSVFGYPVAGLKDIPPGEYQVQALLNRYETFHLHDGRTLSLPPDKGEGQQWNRKPGNLYSAPENVYLDPGKNEVVNIVLDQKIPEADFPGETDYIKVEKIRSDLLSEFWGRPVYLGAHVLLPDGFEDHPEARYPLVINHGHYRNPYMFDLFRERPPDPGLEPEYSDRFDWDGYNLTVQEYAYKFYQYWTAPDTPRMILITIQHPNPYFDDSYAVNSANLGPYGDAVMHELVPYIEKKYRGIGEGWARFVYGGSTGGWEALAAQVFYPDDFNACFAACPDSITFRSFFIVDIYNHNNAYYLDSRWKHTPRPGNRNYLGEISNTMEEINHLELVLGTESRSGGTLDIYNAVYSPVGENGYPAPIWDKKTGVIDDDVAQYWKQNYDLLEIMKRDWNTLGPKLKGKIHIYCGDMDNWYLNNAVYWMEDFLENTKEPYYSGDIDYGDRAEHCWNGDHCRPNAISRLRYQQMYAPKMVERMQANHPPGADLTSWRH